MKSPTAILFFSRSARAEASEKFAGGKGLGQKIATALIDRTTRILSRVRLPVYHFDECDQVGDRFGDRLTGCIQRVFDFGYESVLVIGNDAPQLTARHITAASRRLERGDVIGPDGRGGIYLLGLHRATFDRLDLGDANWQSRALCRQLVNVLDEPQVLGRLADCNAVHDILRNWHLWKHQVGVLAFLVVGRFTEIAFVPAYQDRSCLRTTAGRAPPTAA